MPFLTTIVTALGSLAANKLRSILAMLGIIIGVASVIAMLALGKGAQKQVMDRFTSMGTNLLFIRPGSQGSRGVTTGQRQNLTVKDAKQLVREIPQLAQVTPVARGNGQIKYLNQNTRTNIVGVAMTYFSMQNFQAEKGRIFSELEAESRARVAVLGALTAETLFQAQEPIGKVIKINSINFKVIGVLKAKGDQGWFNPDDQVLVPYSTAMKQVLGVDYLNEISMQVKDAKDVDLTLFLATQVLRRAHNLGPKEEDDFSIRNMLEMVEAATEATSTFTLLLGGIAGISLLVGGIGIMNIMLVSVTERTREIGIRKALGAKDRDVLLQFLVESMVMSFTGGVLGALAGVGVARAGNGFGGFTPVVEPSAIILSLGFSTVVGIFFGFYPAWRASMLDPIECLRYE